MDRLLFWCSARMCLRVKGKEMMQSKARAGRRSKVSKAVMVVS